MCESKRETLTEQAVSERGLSPHAVSGRERCAAPFGVCALPLKSAYCSKTAKNAQKGSGEMPMRSKRVPLQSSCAVASL